MVNKKKTTNENTLPDLFGFFFIFIGTFVFKKDTKRDRMMKRNFSPETSDRFEYLQALVTEFQDTDSEGKTVLL